jgi:hypothetical protein
LAKYITWQESQREEGTELILLSGSHSCNNSFNLLLNVSLNTIARGLKFQHMNFGRFIQTIMGGGGSKTPEVTRERLQRTAIILCAHDLTLKASPKETSNHSLGQRHQGQ